MPLPPMTTSQQLSLELARTERELVEDLISARERMNLSQADVARIINRDRSAITRLQKRSGEPKLSTLLRDTHAVGCVVSFQVDDFEDWRGTDVMPLQSSRGWKTVAAKETEPPHAHDADCNRYHPDSLPRWRSVPPCSPQPGRPRTVR